MGEGSSAAQHAVNAIEVEGLSKTFHVRERAPGLWGAVKGLFAATTSEVAALRDVRFALQPGERVAFVGPNGAGKSTTIKCLTGLLRPSGGSMTILGMDPVTDPVGVKRKVGVMPEGLVVKSHHGAPPDTAHERPHARPTTAPTPMHRVSASWATPMSCPSTVRAGVVTPSAESGSCHPTGSTRSGGAVRSTC